VTDTTEQGMQGRYLKHAGTMPGRDARTAALRAFLVLRGWCLAFYLCFSYIYKFQQ